MEMENEYKIVEFSQYCETCKHRNVKETKDPCNECLEHPVNLHTTRPVNWEEK